MIISIFRMTDSLWVKIFLFLKKKIEQGTYMYETMHRKLMTIVCMLNEVVNLKHNYHFSHSYTYH